MKVKMLPFFSFVYHVLCNENVSSPPSPDICHWSLNKGSLGNALRLSHCKGYSLM